MKDRIAVDNDQVASVLSKLTAARDSAGIPTASSITVQGPAGHGATSYFNSGMSAYSYDLKAQVDELRTNLMRLHEDITQTVNEFAARDELIADETASVRSSMESVTPVVPTSTANTKGY
jgi:nicotinamide mononucleotide (NMN) deamidase PncC